MKQLLVCLIAVVMTLTGSQAQESTKSKTSRWGASVFAGLNYSYPRINTGYPAHFSPHANLLAGIDVNYRLNPRASLHAQPSWTRIDKVRPDRDIYSLSPGFSITTIKIPLLYRYYILPTHRSLFVEVGVGYNQLVKSDYREEITMECLIAPCPTYYTSNIPASNKSAISGLAGVGVNIELHKISIPITLRYERYLSDYTFPGQYRERPAPIKFESFALTTGVNF